MARIVPVDGPLAPQLIPGIDGKFLNNRGEELHTRSWLPRPEPGQATNRPLGIILLCHGYVSNGTTHSELR